MVTPEATNASVANEVIDELKALLRSAIADVAPRDADYAILDFPNHFNIGDSAIYIGETILCREHFGREPRLVSETFGEDIERIAKLDPKVILLFHGGGNFGDLYPRYQLFRETILSRFPERRIILLPQSIHYSDQALVARTAAIVNSHPNFTMMVRDHASREFAERHFKCRIMLVPDSAFMLGAIKPVAEPELKALAVLRTDDESVLSEIDIVERLPQPADLVDWPNDWRAKRKIDRLPRFLRALMPPRVQGAYPVTPAAFEALARKRVDRGIKMLSRGQIIITDRLHVHILAFLLGKPHIVLDNSYGKLSSFIAAWTKRGPLVQARTISDALEEAKKLSVPV